MKRRMVAMAFAGLALFAGPPAAQASTCVESICIAVHCPGGGPDCVCVDEWVLGYYLYQCLFGL